MVRINFWKIVLVILVAIISGGIVRALEIPQELPYFAGYVVGSILMLLVSELWTKKD